MRMQKEVMPLLEVKPGAWGSGVFATSYIKRGTYLGEYIAEVFTNERYDEYHSEAFYWNNEDGCITN